MTVKRANPSHVPPLPLALSFGLALAALALVAGARIVGFTPEGAATAAQVVQSRVIRFDRQADGTLAVIDDATGGMIASETAATQGFLSGALRGLNRIRKGAETADEAPYRLERRANGQLLLIDTASGLALDLNAYGRSNAAAFGEFLETTGDKS